MAATTGSRAAATSAVAVAAVILVGWWALSGWASHGNSSPRAVDSTTYPQVGPDEAIRMTMAGMPRQDFLTLNVVPSTEENSASRLWMHATMTERAPGSESQSRRLWEACIAEGAIAERLAGDATNLEQVLAGVHIKVESPDGSTTWVGGCGGGVKPGHLFTAQAEHLTDDDIAGSVNEALAQFGLTVDDVDVMRPLGPAVAVVASVDDVDTIAGDFGKIQQAILGDPYRYEGLYIELRGPDGARLAACWSALRSGTGGVSFAPGMDDKLGIVHGGIATFTTASGHGPEHRVRPGD